MKIQNPETNQLPQGIEINDIKLAVDSSGYPLQTIIAQKLLDKDFMIQDEWSYVDSQSNSLRTMDIVAQKMLWNLEKYQPRIRPELNLLIECKQSNLPYIFFLNNTKPIRYEFPIIAGVPHEEITISSNDTISTYINPVYATLGLEAEAFFRETPEFCSTFSKCSRRGKNIELSGSDAYNGLVLPLIKATQYFESSQKSKSSAVYHDAHLTIPLGIVDAPMFGVRVLEKGNELFPLPWVRVLKHESFENNEAYNNQKLYALDVVHKDYFDTYMNEHLIPFAKVFSERVHKHEKVLLAGKGFIRDMESQWPPSLEERLEVKSFIKRTSNLIPKLLKK
ncbi:hypothetical protein [Planococcus halotolerans]|uniref:Uncharacterized protein n=1 Tax=Planococcus halotolerans TaxID=2233542 RepID=A0A365KJY7_9BACL|nr:hypothetical protein [Planococcus halotolerans]RAZ73460.1 hypothetical protein DP120_17155 [Planococcus halotolerans]